MNPASIDVKDLLVTEGIGTFGENLFVGKEPAQPNECITIYDTTAGEQNPKLAIDEVSIQVRVRSANYMGGYSRANSVKISLEGRSPITLNTTNYIAFWATSISFVHYDENDRAIFTINFRITRLPSEQNSGNRQNY